MEILENICIAEATTFNIGGRVRYCLKPTTASEFSYSLRFLKEKNLPYFIIGAGSNVLIGSKDFEGGVILTLNMNSIFMDNGFIRAEAGASNSDVALFALDNGIKDLDFLYGMPGTIGGSTFMNARAFGISMSDIIKRVEIIDDKITCKTLELPELEYGYKQSIFQKYTDYNIATVHLKASKGSRKEIENKMMQNKKRRIQTKQYDYPSAGCIFKNDYNIGIPIGKIIDELGLKGKKLGDLQISNEHANFIINKGKATSDEVISLINYIKEEVKQKKDISLDCEIRFLGNF